MKINEFKKLAFRENLTHNNFPYTMDCSAKNVYVDDDVIRLSVEP